MKRLRTLSGEEGNVLIISVVITALLVATGLAYMRWAADERYDSAYEKATIQAYFVAQTGLIEQGLKYLRTRTPSDLPQGRVYLQPGIVENVGSYYNTTVQRVAGTGYQDVFQRSDTYDLYSTGRVHFYDQQLGPRHLRVRKYVERTATMRARLRSFANYMYLTNIEKAHRGGVDEIVWFWTYDTLYGRTHSNDFIGLKYSPHFYGPVSTSQDRFIYYNPQNIYFAYDPIFNAPPVYFPTTANTLRANARWISGYNGRYMTRIKMKGDRGYEIHQYVLGTQPRDSLVEHFNPMNYGAIFVDGQVEIQGPLYNGDGGVVGNLTIGSSGDMWLIDDIVYAGADARNGQFEEEAMQHMLGLVSERNIIIRDNVPNGYQNGWANGSRPQATHLHSIIITAGMVALNESFTFEHQNDDWESYQGPTPDERGIIHLKGSVTQMRRGYVHRSNHVGTGYGKDYHYDFRFDRRPPPYYLEAQDENGFGLFDIVSWGEERPKKR